MVIQFDEDKQKIQYQKLREEEEEKFLEIAASNQQIPYIDLSIHPIDNDALRLMDEKEATSSQTVPFTITGKKLGVASRNPSSETTKAIAGKLQAKGFIITLYLTSKKRIVFQRRVARRINRDVAGSHRFSDQRIDFPARGYRKNQIQLVGQKELPHKPGG